jgi:hypothetical protein
LHARAIVALAAPFATTDAARSAELHRDEAQRGRWLIAFMTPVVADLDDAAATWHHESMAFFSHPAWLLSLLAASACGADAGDGSSRPAGVAPVARPEPDENGVRVRGAEPNTFNNDGISECVAVRREVSIEEARDLGLPIDTHLAWFAQRHESSLHYGPPSCGASEQPSSDTQITLQMRPLETYLVSFETNPQSGGDCTSPTRDSDYLTYDAVIEVETADGSVTGTFYAPVTERQGQLSFAVGADVRNFEGTLELPVNIERMHYAELGIAANIGSEEMTGGLQASVIYVDSDPWAAGEGELVYFPARSGAADWYCWTNGASEPVPGSEPFTLDAYPGSNPPATFPLRLQVLASDGTSADVEVIVGGEPLQLGGVSGIEERELGSVELGTELAVSVRNREGDGRVSVVLLSNGCVVAAADCSGTACSSNYAASLALPYCG